MMKALINDFRKMASKVLKSKQVRRHSLVGAGNLWKMKRDFQIKFLLERGLKKSDKLMDLGCGTLRGGIPIIKYLEHDNYVGLDVREQAIEEAKKELESNKLDFKNPKLIAFSHFKDIKIEFKFDVIFAFSVLIHLEDSILEDCFQFVNKSISENGVFYANVIIGDSDDGKWFEFPVVFRTIEFYEQIAKKHGLSVEVLGTLKDMGHISGTPSDGQQQMLKITQQ